MIEYRIVRRVGDAPLYWSVAGAWVKDKDKSVVYLHRPNAEKVAEAINAVDPSADADIVSGFAPDPVPMPDDFAEWRRWLDRRLPRAASPSPRPPSLASRMRAYRAEIRATQARRHKRRWEMAQAAPGLRCPRCGESSMRVNSCNTSTLHCLTCHYIFIPLLSH